MITIIKRINEILNSNQLPKEIIVIDLNNTTYIKNENYKVTKESQKILLEHFKEIIKQHKSGGD